MKVEAVDRVLARLDTLIGEDRFEDVETDTLEFKAVPSTGNEWHKAHESACAFLNTRGGVIIFGVREEGSGEARRYRVTGWQPHAESNVRDMASKFTDEDGHALKLTDAFPPPEIREFRGHRIGIVLVDELSADTKFAFYRGIAYRRVLTGDVKITEQEVVSQREYRISALQAREVQQVPGTSLESLELERLNEFITELNRPVKIETIKADLGSAVGFLERKSFIKDGVATLLGILICGKHPADVLGFRCHVHGYVDIPQAIAQDKQDYVGNVLYLMENAWAYLLRNIQVGVTAERSGGSRPQYPDQLLRESVNNALAHRDYSTNRQVILTIKPGEHIAIRNPGTFRRDLLIQSDDEFGRLRRILPEAKPRNPKLADALRVFRKWEGRGIGMATMVNLCLDDEIDLPYYIFGSEEVTLHLCTGQLVDERVRIRLQSFDRYITDKLHGGALTASQMRVLAYLMKSEWANELYRFTVMLTPDNNHFGELTILQQAGLISTHPSSTNIHPIFVVDRTLMRHDYYPELRAMFGIGFDLLGPVEKDVLSVLYRFGHYSKAKAASARQVSFDLWRSRGQREDIRAFDAFNRQVRRAVIGLQSEGFIERNPSRRFVLPESPRAGMLGGGG